MVNAIYSYFEVDTADIWNYERQLLKKGASPDIYDSLLRTIEPIITERQNPFLLHNEELNSSSLKYTRGFKQKYKKRATDYFEVDGDFFFLNEPCILSFENTNPRDFAFLFALKTRQYHDNIAGLDSFFYHQLKANFTSDLKQFLSFFKSVLIQFSNILTDSFHKKFELWEIDFDRNRLVNAGDKWLFENPEYWDVLPVGLTDEQIKAFFSFLYLEKNDRGLPFLERKEVDALFKFGGKVPPKPLVIKFKLNLTSKNRKVIIEQCVYSFFERYSLNFKKKQLFLRFLAYQFKDFENVRSQKEFKNWGKNFTKSKLKNPLPFDIKKYYEKVKAI